MAGNKGHTSRWLVYVALWMNLNLAVFAAVAPKCKQGLYGVLLPLSAFPPAQSFCSANFPIPPVTSTSTTTSTSTAFATVTVTSATSTVSTTTTFSTATQTTTTTTDTTVTTTTTTSTSFVATVTVGLPAQIADPDKRAEKDKRAAYGAAPSCTAGARLNGVAGRTCTVECDKDRPGVHYKKLQVPSFKVCANTCAADAKCADAQYHSNTGLCYLKKDLKQPTNVSKVSGVVCKKPAATTTKAPIATSKPYVDPKHALLSQLKAQKREFVSTLCSCIETPRTVVAHKTVTTRTTVTAVSSATATTTTTISTTTTSTATITTGTLTTVTDTVTTTTEDTSTFTNTACSAVYTSFNGIANDCGRTDEIARAYPTAGPPNFYAVFNGQGVTENPDNMGNTGPSKSESYDDIPAANNCDAIDRCANFCVPTTNIDDQFWSFDLHYFCLAATWECICYFDVQYFGEAFDVPNPLISQAYGYCAFFD